MKIPSLEDIQQLIKIENGLTISLYMPTFKKSVETLQNPIRFKNLVTLAEEQLSDRGVPEARSRELLQPWRELQNQYDFWQQQEKGLASFRWEDDLRLFGLPSEPPEEVFVGERFYVKPLLRWVTGQDRFYLLALSQNGTRLLRCSRDTESEIEVEQMPRNMAEALRHTETQRQLQFHTGSGEARGMRAAVFHGHGIPKDDEKVRIIEYFRLVDKSLKPVLKGEEEIPLVLAGVEFLFPLYKEASSHPEVVAGVKGNPEGLSAEQLRKKAWELIKPRLHADRRNLARKFEELAGTDQASDDPEQVLPAALQGRVESLFIPVDVHLWGSLNQNGRFETHEERRPESLDLLDFTAVETLSHRGKVFAVPTQKLPGKGPLAAIFRY